MTTGADIPHRTHGSTPDRTPLLLALGVAAVSITTLVLAVRHGWLGPDIGRGIFCEAPRTGHVKQPANTWSNSGFVVAGLLAAAHSGRRPTHSAMPRRLATTFACIVVLMGPASAAMHATQSACGGHLDLFSMYLIAGFAASYAWVRWTRRGPAAFAVAYVVCLVVCQSVGLWPDPVPVVQHAGNLVFALLLVVALVLEVRLWRRGENERTIGFGIASLGSLLLAFSIWLATNAGWCDPYSWLQGHAVWHLLCAMAAYFLYRLYASERALLPEDEQDALRAVRPAS